MGKKKFFIDKKKAVTYSLVFQDQDEAAEGAVAEGALIPMGSRPAPVGPGGPAQAGGRGSDGPGSAHDGEADYDESLYESEYGAEGWAYYENEDEDYEMGEERRAELLSLGFPDDGYDYLRHLRDLGRGRSRAAPDTIPEGDEQALEGFEEEEGDEDLLEEVSDGGGGGGGDDFALWDGQEQPQQPEPGSSGAAAGGQEDPGAGPSTSYAPSAAPAAGSLAGAGRRGGGAASVAAGSTRSRATRSRGAAASVAASARSGKTSFSLRSTYSQASSAVGPSVFIPATKFVVPTADVKLVDARRLHVQGKVYNDAEAAAKVAEISAFARPMRDPTGKSGRLAKDLDELQRTMAAMESDDMRRVEVVEGDENADWLDDFVAGVADEGEGAAAAGPGPSGPRARAAEGQEDDEEEEEGDSELQDDESEDEEEEQEARRGAAGAAGASASGRGGGAAGPPSASGGGPPGKAMSVASSQWRPERSDRKEGLEHIDSRFEKLALEYEDEHLGDLEEEEEDDDDMDDDADGGGAGGRTAAAAAAAARQRADTAARGTCELSDFADVLDEFLHEHRAAEALEAEGLRPLRATAADEVITAANQLDPEAIAATRARLARVMEASAEVDKDADRDAQPTYLEEKQVVVLQGQERWDCESVLSLRSNLEHYPAKIVEPQRRTGSRGGGLIHLSAKTGMPKLQPQPQLGAGAAIREEEGEGEEVASSAGEGSGSDSGDEGSLAPGTLARRKGETPEEKKARKAAVKEARKSQRAAKKEVKTMFRQEGHKAQRQSAGRSVAAGSTYAIP